MYFKIVSSLSKNKANVGDKFVIENGHRTVIEVTNKYVILDNKREYPVRWFNQWMRISSDMSLRESNSIKKSKAVHLKEKELDNKLRFKKDDIAKQKALLTLYLKEAKAVYDEKYRQPEMDRMGSDSTLKRYVCLTGGKEIRFYFSPTFKADVEDLELSYRSLHGPEFKVFAHGYYIQHGIHIALIGMSPYRNASLSVKRINYAMFCLNKCMIGGMPVVAKLYENMHQFFNEHDAVDSKLLSSNKAFANSLNEEPKPASKPTENKHWSGLSGEMAQDHVDVGLENMYRGDEPDSDYPF